MYSKNETPLFGAAIFYYDNKYERTTSQAVAGVLEQFGYFPPERVYAGKLTNNRVVSSPADAKRVFVQAYSEKDIIGIELLNGNIRSGERFWRMMWNFTFLKNSKLAIKAPKFQPWNVLMLNTSYSRLNNDAVYSDFFSCVKGLIEVLCPFYAVFDDIANRVHLLERTREKTFVPGRVQQIYWGNYLGEEYCRQYGYKNLSALPAQRIEALANGCLFFLTDRATGFSSSECKSRRAQIMQYLQNAAKKETNGGSFV